MGWIPVVIEAEREERLKAEREERSDPYFDGEPPVGGCLIWLVAAVALWRLR